MALTITASPATVQGLRALKFGKFAAMQDMTALTQTAPKKADDQRDMYLSGVGWVDAITALLGSTNEKYRVFTHEPGTLYAAIPNFLSAGNSFKTIIDIDKQNLTVIGGYGVGGFGNLAGAVESTARAPRNHPYLSFSGPFMYGQTKAQYAQRLLQSKAYYLGGNAWDPYNVPSYTNDLAHISYSDARSPKFEINAGEIIEHPGLDGFGGLDPLILNGVCYWPTSKPLPNSTYRPSGTLNSYIADPYNHRSLVAYSKKHDMLLVIQYQNKIRKGVPHQKPLDILKWQATLKANDFNDCVFTDGSDSIFLYDKKPYSWGIWHIHEMPDSPARRQDVTVLGQHFSFSVIVSKNNWWLPIAAMIDIAP